MLRFKINPKLVIFMVIAASSAAIVAALIAPAGQALYCALTATVWAAISHSLRFFVRNPEPTAMEYLGTFFALVSVIVGILFMTTTAIAILAGIFLGQKITAKLQKASANAGEVTQGASPGD